LRWVTGGARRTLEIDAAQCDRRLMILDVLLVGVFASLI
jgi:hypothetical protein